MSKGNVLFLQVLTFGKPLKKTNGEWTIILHVNKSLKKYFFMWLFLYKTISGLLSVVFCNLTSYKTLADMLSAAREDCEKGNFFNYTPYICLDQTSWKFLLTQPPCAVKVCFLHVMFVGVLCFHYDKYFIQHSWREQWYACSCSVNIVLIISSHMKLCWNAVKQSCDLLNRYWAKTCTAYLVGLIRCQ